MTEKKKVIVVGATEPCSMVEKYRVLHPDTEVIVMSRIEFEKLVKERTMNGDMSLIAIQAQMHAIDHKQMNDDLMKSIEKLERDLYTEDKVERNFQKQQNRYRSQHYSRNIRRR